MNRRPAARFAFDFFEPLPIQIEVSDAPLTSDAGLLPLRQFDQRIGLTQQFAAVLDDPRHPDLIEHSFMEMVRMRIFGILAGYQDQNDHDTLRTDSVFKLSPSSCAAIGWRRSRSRPATRPGWSVVNGSSPTAWLMAA